MKRWLLYPVLFLFSFLLLLVLALASVIFFRPQWIVNPRGLNFALERTQLLKKWSWDEARMNHDWREWNRRGFEGYFKNFCFEYQKSGLDLSSCIETLKWDVEFSFLDGKGMRIIAKRPVIVHSPLTNIRLSKQQNKQPASSSPPDLWKYWQMIWSRLVPEMDLEFRKINILTAKDEMSFDFKLYKAPERLSASALGFDLTATSGRLELLAPSKYPFPKKFKLMDPFFFHDVKLTALMKEEGIPFEIKGALEAAQFKIDSYLKLPLEGSFTSVDFRKDLLLKTKAQLHIPGVKKNISHYAPDPYKELPAPFNVMDGTIDIQLESRESEDRLINILSTTHVNLKGPKQVLDFDLQLELPLDVQTNDVGSILLGLTFNQVTIQLPRLSKKSPPPQMMPDRRIKNQPYQPQKTQKDKVEMNMHLQALNEKAMRFRSNLLDEVLRLNFDLIIKGAKLSEGYLKALPLETTIFKRPIHLKSLHITFDEPLEPVIESTIRFPLPEYKITLKLEGPLSKPRYSFSSHPPLPQNDIYAVLLFGRPLNELDTEDKTAAQKTNQLLAQGILSLSVLYYLAGSPVEYVGYDPETKSATAQFGLGSKTSLRIGGGEEGVNSSSIRRSLGKGWYLDTSVQNTSGISNTGTRDYGALLERIISF